MLILVEKIYDVICMGNFGSLNFSYSVRGVSSPSQKTYDVCITFDIKTGLLKPIFVENDCQHWVTELFASRDYCNFSILDF